MQRLFMLFVFAVVLSTAVEAQGKFSGEAFGDYFYNVTRDTAFSRANLPASALGGPVSNQGWVLRRLNLTYDYTVSDQVSTRIRFESDGSGGTSGTTTSDGKLAFYVKDAWLKWNNVLPGAALIFGIQPTPLYDGVEPVWGFRSVEKTLPDLRGVLSTRAFGGALKGSIDSAGTIGYTILVANKGAGYNPKDLGATSGTGQTDKYNLYAAAVQWKPNKEIVITAYGDFRPAAPVNDPTSTSAPKTTVDHSTTTGDLFVGYQVPDEFSFGVEGLIQVIANNYSDPASALTTKPLKGQTTFGVSVFGTYSITPTLGLLARFDRFDPKLGSSTAEHGDSRSYIIAGIAFKIAKSTFIVPNVQIESYESIPNTSISPSASVNARVTFATKF